MDETDRLRELYRSALTHLRALARYANHRPGCSFTGCTCGKMRDHSDAQLDANKFLREIKQD